MDLQKRHNAAEMLGRSDLLYLMRIVSEDDIPDIKTMFERFRFISSMIDDPHHLPFRFKKYYRNHIYPAEIQDIGSIFHGANVDRIDAILIDMDPCPNNHIAHRGKYVPS